MASTERLRIVFAASDGFAIPTLLHLVADPQMNVIAVICPPDQPLGRGQKVQQNIVAAICSERGLNFHQTKSDSELINLLKEIDHDFLVVCAYGVKLGTHTLEAPNIACVNLHPSLLPRWRGAAPIERAVLAGDTETGVTTMLMAEKMDAGPILMQKKVHIGSTESGGELRERLSVEGAQLVHETLANFRQIEPAEQNPSAVSYAPKFKREEELIDWNESASAVNRKVRAMNPNPGAFAKLGFHELKVYESAVERKGAAPGEVVEAQGDRLVIGCDTDCLRLIEVQPSGGTRMSAADWLRGRGKNLTSGLRLI